ncbi:MAG: NADH-quinone oxidoreductase subunit L [Gemmatimonadales bacterium]
MSASWITVVVALPFLGFLANGALSFWRPDAKRAVSIIGTGVLWAAFGLAVPIALNTSHQYVPEIVTLWQWMPVGDLGVAFAFQVDRLSVVMLLVVTGVGSLIHTFSIGYMRADPGYARYFAYLNLFVFFMLVLVFGANFPMLFIGWEGVGLCSYLLIGFWFTEKTNADAGKKAFIMNRIGDFGLLMAMFLIFRESGTLAFTAVFDSALQTYVLGGPEITAIALLLFLGCTGKSAQIPLYTWLPDAMAGPTPVSALIHAATMVTAGIYLIARANVLFAMAPVAMAVVATIGAVTALWAASIALKQWDIKKVLAYSTVSQLGYMFLGVGVGAYAAGVFHLVTHAFFKALLFLGSGSVIYAMHHAYHSTHSHDDAQDMRNMGGLRRWMPWTAGLMWIATLAIAGIPGFSGFFSKDEILAMTFARGHDHPLFYVLWVVGTVTALMTAFYMTRMMLYTFHGPNRTGDNEQGHLHEAPKVMTAPLVVLAVLSAVGGLLNLPAVLPGAGWLHHWLEPVTAAGQHLVPELHLAHSTEWLLLGLATVIAAAGIAGAWFLLKPDGLSAAKAAPAETGFQKILLKKWYVDEIYDAVIVQPIAWLSDKILWQGVDAGAIDGGLVNGSARVARIVGSIGSWVQSGAVGWYVTVFTLGALWLLHQVAGA